MRSDVSFTLFLCPPESYRGGELLFELDTARRALFRQQGKTAEFDRLAKVCANPLRMRAEP